MSIISLLLTIMGSYPGTHGELCVPIFVIVNTLVHSNRNLRLRATDIITNVKVIFAAVVTDQRVLFRGQRSQNE